MKPCKAASGYAAGLLTSQGQEPARQTTKHGVSVINRTNVGIVQEETGAGPGVSPYAISP